MKVKAATLFDKFTALSKCKLIKEEAARGRFSVLCNRRYWPGRVANTQTLMTMAIEFLNRPHYRVRSAYYALIMYFLQLKI